MTGWIFTTHPAFAKRNNQIVLNDKNSDQDKEHIKELEGLGVKVILGDHPDDILDESFDYLIKNPGVHFDHKYLVYAQSNRFKICDFHSSCEVSGYNKKQA
jgi:UDP-N-acetylmuramoylalanine-D-glutamate ligase